MNSSQKTVAIVATINLAVLWLLLRESPQPESEKS
jgi:hypothetical protein